VRLAATRAAGRCPAGRGRGRSVCEVTTGGSLLDGEHHRSTVANRPDRADLDGRCEGRAGRRQWAACGCHLAWRRRRTSKPCRPALSLASAGYVVVSPVHRDDNFTDQSHAASPTLFTDRVNDVNVAVDFIVNRWSEASRVDSTRVGAFGMSAGGFTVLTAVGAQPDMRLLAPHCQTTPEFVCQVFTQIGSPLLAADTAWPGQALQASPYIKTAVVGTGPWLRVWSSRSGRCERAGAAVECRE
jgi:hypothetical protein